MLDHQTDPTERALWHLELLGCYSPEEAVAPYVPEPAAPIDFVEGHPGLARAKKVSA